MVDQGEVTYLEPWALGSWAGSVMMEVRSQYSILLSLESTHYSFCCCFQVKLSEY